MADQAQTQTGQLLDGSTPAPRAEPRISIAMTTYNSQRFVVEQLESFVRQDRLPDELVVSDDASNDGTVAILQEFALRASFPVRVLVNERNLGVTRNFERAIAECSGDFIFLSDADDCWYPKKIRVMEKALEEMPTAGVVICNADLANEQLEPLGSTAWASVDRFLPSRKLLSEIACGKTYKRNMPAGGSCMAFRAKFKPLLLPLAGPYDHFIACTIVCSGVGGALLLPEPLIAYRRHRGQATQAATPPPFFKWIQRRQASRQERVHLMSVLTARLESDFAARHCLNAGLRDSALRHWRARISMPAWLPARVPKVATELVTLRYHRFASGMLTAAKDLVLP